MYGEIRDWVFSKEHRAEHVLLDGWRNILEIFQYGETWQSIYGDHVLEFVKEQLRASDCEWRLNLSGEITKTNYGDKNFIHHGAENTYLERFKDRNI